MRPSDDTSDDAPAPPPPAETLRESAAEAAGRDRHTEDIPPLDDPADGERPDAVDQSNTDDHGDHDGDTEFAAAIERTAAALHADDEVRARRLRWAAQVGAGALALVLALLLLGYLAWPGDASPELESRATDAVPAAPPPAIEQWLPPATDAPGQKQYVRPSDAFAGWARQLTDDLDIPLVALQAYGYTEAVLHRTQPNCNLSWTLLAGIGEVESDHGRHGDSRLNPDGTSEPRIVGVPLDGNRTELIPDTDQGALDGDRRFDRAVGAMQFIPSTWSRWAVDGDGDGRTDPYDLDDATLAAGYYLCANGRDLSTSGGWWNAVLSYNNLTPYADRVFAAADGYGRASRTGG